MTLIRWTGGLLAVLAAMILTGPAHADDISAAARGVVRVVLSASINGESLGSAHGSGFAIGPNTIVTNAHVVELAKKFPSIVTINIVPSEGSDHYQGELVTLDEDRDLALIHFDGPPLPPLTLFSRPVPDGTALVSLGYPANVDQATGTTPTDMLDPMAPVRSTGVLSSHRSQRGIDGIEHTAQIARGNSGGPLLDDCGRVIAVNRAVTTGQDGDGSFVLAVAEDELAAFLKSANQPFNAVSWPCVSMADYQAQTQQQAQQQSDAQQQAVRDRELQVQRAHDSAVEAAQQANENTRDNFMAGAALLLVLGALAVGGGGLLLSRDCKRPAIWTASGGALLMVGAISLFLFRPDFDPNSITLPDQGSDSTTPQPATGAMVCKLDPDRSRITVSDGRDVAFDWNANGCAGKAQYVETRGSWEHVTVPANAQTATLSSYDPVTRTLTRNLYFESDDQMAQLRKMEPDKKLKLCSANEAVLAELASRQSSLRSLLPAQPDERLVYHCAPKSTK